MAAKARASVGQTAAERTAAIMAEGAGLAEQVPGQLELPGTVAAEVMPAAIDVDSASDLLSVANVREALRRAPHRPEASNARVSVDLPADVRAQLSAYREWHQLPERALITHLVRQLLAADPDGGWRG